MDKKGQLSAEYILFLGFVLVAVLMFANYIADQNEQNNIATATRLGAENATTTMAIMNPGMLPVQVNSIQTTGNQNITIIINLSYKSTQIQNTTLTSVYNTLVSQGYSPQKNSQNLTVNTTRHFYSIMLA